MLSKDGGVCTIHFESVVENTKTCMLTLRRLLRSRPELNSGTAHIFWHMMDERMYFWCHRGIMCSHGSHQRFLECAFIIFCFWIYDLTENTNHNTMKASRHSTSGGSVGGTTSFRKALLESSFDHCRPSNDFP